MGCTVVAVPFGGTYVLGRNFDFEGGRIFDTEKIVKWVFPSKGNAFVSVIWAGMVGAVTGVNERGVYISLNAAGSSDTRRLGTPSTLVLLKVLQEANNAEDALRILQTEQMFITDIFVVMDNSGRLFRVEKSPTKMAAMQMRTATVVTNHLNSPVFSEDSTNQFRKGELTSVAREKRGLELLKTLPPSPDAKSTVNQVLSILRDKGVDEKGQALNLGNRLAIDSLIATHSVIYNAPDGVFFVSEGPALAGRFFGFDLKASFLAHRPVQVAVLDADPLVPVTTFNAIKEANQKISKAHRLVRFKRCTEGLRQLGEIDKEWQEQSPFYHALGDAQACLGNLSEARAAWTRALSLNPAYGHFRQELERNLQR